MASRLRFTLFCVLAAGSSVLSGSIHAQQQRWAALDPNNESSSPVVWAASEDEARRLYDEFPVPGAGLPLFQAAVANFNPKSETLVDRVNPDRGPMKFLSGEKDHTVPWAITNAAYQKQRPNPAVTEIEELPGRGHSLVIDSGWEEVADAALTFVQKYHA